MTPIHRFPRLVACASLLLGALGPAPAVAHQPVAEKIQRVTAELEGDPAAELFLERGDLHRLAGHWDAAVRDCEKALLLNPGLLGARLCLSRIALERGDAQAAAREATALLAKSESADGYRVLARAQARLGRTREAAVSFHRVIELADPARPGDYLEAARLLRSVRPADVDGALASLDAGMERLGPLPVLQAAAVEIARDAGRFDAALHRVDRILQSVDRSETWTAERGRILLVAGRAPEAWAAFSKALAAIEELPAHHRSTPAVRQLEAEMHRRLRHPEEGITP